MYDLWFLTWYIPNSEWNNFKEKYPHARYKFITVDFKTALYECAKESFTKMFWTVTDQVSISNTWNFDIKLELYDIEYIHAWPSYQNKFFDTDSVILWPKNVFKYMNGDLNSILHNRVKNHPEFILKKFEIFFISYEEETAEENWKAFYNKFPTAKRIHKIKGINNAHKKCAELSGTSMFYTIDADTIVDDNWDFSFMPPIYDRDYVHLWYSRNPVNNLEYGYGSIKLWPRNKVLSFESPFIDFTTGVGNIKICDKVISTTVYNTSEYSTWKSAFRECIKLAHNIKNFPDDTESKYRLLQWQTVFNDVPYSKWAKNGAEDARIWYNANIDNVDKINNFQWLKNTFKFRYSQVIMKEGE